MSTANVMTAAVLDAHDASFRVGPVARPESIRLTPKYTRAKRRTPAIHCRRYLGLT
jgi:hypothetical protein